MSHVTIANIELYSLRSLRESKFELSEIALILIKFRNLDLCHPLQFELCIPLSSLEVECDDRGNHGD